MAGYPTQPGWYWLHHRLARELQPVAVGFVDGELRWFTQNMTFGLPLDHEWVLRWGPRVPSWDGEQQMDETTEQITNEVLARALADARAESHHNFTRWQTVVGQHTEERKARQQAVHDVNNALTVLTHGRAPDGTLGKAEVDALVELMTKIVSR